MLVVIVQVTVMPHLRILGVVPDLGLVLAVAVAYRDGAEAGAITGFAAGLGYDLFLATPLGLSALVYALTGVRGRRPADRHVAVTALDPAAPRRLAGLAGGLAFIGIGGLAGVPGMWTTHALTVVGLAAIYDAAVAPLVFLLVNAVSRRDRDAAGAWSVRAGRPGGPENRDRAGAG